MIQLVVSIVASSSQNQHYSAQSVARSLCIPPFCYRLHMLRMGRMLLLIDHAHDSYHVESRSINHTALLRWPLWASYKALSWTTLKLEGDHLLPSLLLWYSSVYQVVVYLRYSSWQTLTMPLINCVVPLVQETAPKNEVLKAIKIEEISRDGSTKK